MLGGIQPAVLSDVLDAPSDGFVERFVFICPDIAPQLVRGSGGADMFMLRTAFQNLHGLKMEDPGDGRTPRPVVFPFDPDAADAFFEFRKSTRRMAHESDGTLAGWIGKADGLVARVAGTFTLLDWAYGSSSPPPVSVPLQAVERAASLWRDYLLPMAKRAFGDAAIPMDERLARRLLREIARRQSNEINQRVVRREWSIEGIGKDAATADRVFAILADAGWLAPAFTRKGGGKGQPKRDWRVNPALFEDRGH